MIETPERRSRIMRAVKSRDTGAELIVRRLAHSRGYRYRLHRSDLPGKPDLAFSGRRKAVFVHGCFWHGHDCVRGARVPKSNRPYWTAKIARNVARDARNQRQLSALGWSVLTVWECELKDRESLAVRLCSFLD
jgi:DNA mismatch endonuclease (patch repair protein)